MKRIISWFVCLLLLLPSLAYADAYMNDTFMNAGGSLTATCHNASGTTPSQDILSGTLPSNTTVALPANSACADGDMIYMKPIQGTNQAYSFTVTATAIVVTSNGAPAGAIASTAGASGVIQLPASTGGTTNVSVDWFFYNNRLTSQWELKTQETLPAALGPNFIINPMSALGDAIYGGVSGAPTRLAGNSNPWPTYFGSQGSGGAATAMALFTPMNLLIVPNAGSTGTTQNTFTVLTGAPSTAVIAGTSTPAVVGITVANAGTTGNAAVELVGQVNCLFDGATTAGHHVTFSGTTGGDCHDTGSAATIGQSAVLSTNVSAGTYSILFLGPGSL